MVRPIMKDIFFLNQKSDPATKADKGIARDLLDTLKANEKACVGLAANMIGVKKRIIAVNMGPVNVVMYNPVIVVKDKAYETKEGCLSLSGERSTRRYEEIEVAYMDMNFQPKQDQFKGFVAQIIQHEIDHCDGIII